MDLALNLGTLRRVLLEQYVHALYRHGLKSRHPKNMKGTWQARSLSAGQWANGNRLDFRLTGRQIDSWPARSLSCCQFLCEFLVLCYRKSPYLRHSVNIHVKSKLYCRKSPLLRQFVQFHVKTISSSLCVILGICHTIKKVHNWDSLSNFMWKVSQSISETISQYSCEK